MVSKCKHENKYILPSYKHNSALDFFIYPFEYWIKLFICLIVFIFWFLILFIYLFIRNVQIVDSYQTYKF